MNLNDFWIWIFGLLHWPFSILWKPSTIFNSSITLLIVAIIDKGLWNIPSKIDFLLACQIAQHVTRIRIPSACETLLHINKTQCIGSEIHRVAITSVTSSSNWAQTHLEIVQNSNAWYQVSSSAPHNLHSAVSTIFLLFSTLTVGMEFKVNRQQKILILGGNSIFHNCFHSLCLFSTSEQLVWPSK